MNDVTTTRKRRPVDPSTIKTEWYGFIRYWRPDTPPEKRHSAHSVRGDTLPLFMADVYQNATFSHGGGCCAVILEDVRLNCCACYGSGMVSIRKGRCYVQKPCKTCRGQGCFDSWDPIELKPSSNVQIVEKVVEPLYPELFPA